MYRFMKFAAVCCGIVLVNGGLAEASWVTMPYGSKTIPQNAMVAGQYPVGTPIYACQASYNGGVHTGWTKAGKGNCSFGWGGSEIQWPSFSIWQNDWVPASNGAIPGGALEFGSEPGQAPPGGLAIPRDRYICAAQDLESSFGPPVAGTSSGKVGTDLGACLFGWGNMEIHNPNYSVLVDGAFVYYQQGWYTSEVAQFNGNTPMGTFQPVTMNYSDTLPYDAVLSGAEANGIPLYVCNTYLVDGYQIGKTRTDYHSCDVSYGGGEYWEFNYNVLVPYWTTYSFGNFPYRSIVGGTSNAYETAVASGTENGAPFYMCRASVDNTGAILTGKVNRNLGYCSIGFNGTEHHVVYDYTVLTDRYTLAETAIR